jgi:hypothetical protein
MSFLLLGLTAALKFGLKLCPQQNACRTGGIAQSAMARKLHQCRAHASGSLARKAPGGGRPNNPQGLML